MSFKEFDMTEINEAKEKYVEEVKERWGSTTAYQESKNKTAKYTPTDWERITTQANEITSGFASLLGKDPTCDDAQGLVRKWQQHITVNYYSCTNEILAGLGEMYVADERFTKNIDKAGAGTAAFMSKAIAHYCKK
ncbi:TipAS antibiotic-recognition domain-containing protein [Bacillus timonensis]|nr:TipAS antibiotic-recognition domain-containing protein [Bacillus timonensis]